MMLVRIMTITRGRKDGWEESGDVSDHVYMIVMRVIDYDLLDGMWVGGWVGGVWRCF